MGEEISTSHFSKQDFNQFNEKIKDESKLLKVWFEKKKFSRQKNIGGCELEAWLVGSDNLPKAKNTSFIEALNDPDVVHEIAKFNIEFNTSPQSIAGNGIAKIKDDLDRRWKQTEKKAAEMNLRLMMIGVLPTVNKKDLNLGNMTPSNRYMGLNTELMKIRNQSPIELNIKGKDHLRLKHNDVMLKAAATSFQIHLQVNQEEGPTYYNSSKIASAPLVAIASNSPFLFNHQLWEESRIPLFTP